mgnify:FL=1
MAEVVYTKNAPDAIGPYSQGISAENIAFVSGQLPIDPATGEFAGNDIASQTRQSLKNVQAILAENGMTMADVTKTTVLLADIAEFAEMNQVYAEFFAEPFPARAAFEVAALPKNAKVEIEAIAVKR